MVGGKGVLVEVAINGLMEVQKQFLDKKERGGGGTFVRKDRIGG